MSHYYKQNLLEKVVREALNNVRARNIIVALSGGADSVAIITALTAIKKPSLFPGLNRSNSSEKNLTGNVKVYGNIDGSNNSESSGNSNKYNLSITAAHCNFHLRGEESMRDQKFVENLCQRLEVPLLVRNFDVEEYRRMHPSVSIEMACRDLRYDWFSELMKQLKADRIVTGHNADDNIETLFLNLLRGSGTTGLRGMLSDNGKILRPLLTVHRSEIENYLKEKGSGYIVDSTNLSSDFRRNFIRNEILPQLRQRWPGLNKSLDRSLRLLKAENDIVEKAVSELLPAEGRNLEASKVLAFPAPELLVRRFILPLRPLTTTAEEIVAAMRAAKPDIRQWTLPGGTVILRAGHLSLVTAH